LIGIKQPHRPAPRSAPTAAIPRRRGLRPPIWKSRSGDGAPSYGVFNPTHCARDPLTQRSPTTSAPDPPPAASDHERLQDTPPAEILPGHAEQGAPLPDLTLPPPADAERLKTLDLVRGVAILGIFPVNIGWFFMERPSWWNPWIEGGRPGDRLVAGLTWFVFEQKFITLFSILFGAGLAIRFDRARARGEPFAGRLLRRQAVLLVFGLLHVHLLFYGDVLTTYALLGSFAWLACGLGQRALLGLAVACFGGACAVWYWMWASPHALEGLVMPVAQRWSIALRSLLSPRRVPQEPLDPLLRGIPDHSLGERIAEHCGMVSYFGLTIWIIYGLYVLACFLLGMYLLRRGVFHEPAAQRWCLSGIIIAGLSLGLPLNGAYVITQARHPQAPYLPLFVGVAAPPLALTYLGLLLRWADSGWLPRVQRWLRATGRMALTNYLMQSFVLCFLFRWLPPGLLTLNITRGGALFLVVLVWLFQIALSAAWMQLFRTGPVEWLWRRLAGDRGRGFVRPPGEAAEVP
jgi:uncharacterized protein